MKTLPKFDEMGYPRWKEKALSTMSMRGCQTVVLSTSDPPGVSNELLSAQRRNAWLLLENALERAGKLRIINREMQCNPALLWRKLEETYALAPAFITADAAKEALLALRQGKGPTSLLTYLQAFDEQLDLTQDLLGGAGRSLLDESSLISHCRDGLNKPHFDLSLALLEVTRWLQ